MLGLDSTACRRVAFAVLTLALTFGLWTLGDGARTVPTAHAVPVTAAYLELHRGDERDITGDGHLYWFGHMAHGEVRVVPAPAPAPLVTGTVDFVVFGDAFCAGAPIGAAPDVPLTPGFLFSEAESPALFGIEIDIDGKAVTAAYSGDGFYDPAVMPCTPLCGMADTDCDGMFDDADVDDDGDGCSDVAEGGPNPGAGGMRNSKYGRDFYDVNDSGDIDLGDTLLVLAVFGDIAFAGTPADERDRFAPVAGSPWQTAKASDGVGLADALLNLQSFGHSC